MRTHYILRPMGRALLFPRFGRSKLSFQRSHHNETMSPPTVHLAPLLFFPHDHYLLWFDSQIFRISTLHSPVLRNCLATRRPSRGFSGRAPLPPWRSLDRERTMSATKRVGFYPVLRSSVSCTYPVIYQPQMVKTDQTIPCVFQHNSLSSFAKHGLPPRVSTDSTAALAAKGKRLYGMSIIRDEVEPLGRTRPSPLPS